MKKFLTWDRSVKMNTLMTGLLLVGSNALAAGGDVTVQSFSVIRSGGGQIEVVVAKKGEEISAYTKSCHFKQLTSEEQAKTVFTVAGKDAADADAILSNTVRLASDVTIKSPFIAGGTWSSMSVSYSYDLPQGGTKSAVSEINAPIVIINGVESPVLSDIETQARAANAATCN